MKKYVAVAMSGGVDSTACGLLLRDRFRLKGFFMNLGQPGFEQQRTRVTHLADRLDIPLKVIDLRQEFEKRVLNYFTNSYFSGITPNPCIICNRHIKFGLFLQAALAEGAEMMATGHYANIVHADQLYHLCKGRDAKKDQSYFLSRLGQEQLARVHFPLGSLRKSAVYELVEQYGFDNFRGQESQDVCFLADTTVTDYLMKKGGQTAAAGPIITGTGEHLGMHKGLYRYTIGQRRGLGISSSAPLYVTGIDSEKNALVVGGDSELLKHELTCQDFHWLSGSSPDTERTYTVRIRYTHQGAAARLILHGTTGQILFSKPQRAVTPGQFAVVYQDDELLGSGIIV